MKNDKFKNLVATTERGSIEGLRQLVALVPKCSLPQIKRLLAVFSFRALEVTKLSDVKLMDSTALDRSILPLGGLVKIAIHFVEVFPQDYIDELTKFWPDHIWPCVRFLGQNVTRDNFDDRDGRNQVLTTIIDLLFFFGIESWLLKVVSGTSGVVGLLIKIWTTQPQDPESRLTSSVYDITPSKALQIYMTRYGAENENPDWVGEVLGPINGDVGRLAAGGLCHLRVHDNLQNTTNIDSVTDSLRIIGVLSFYPPIRYALANNHSFRIVTSVLTSITSQPYSPLTARVVCLCIMECCNYLTCWLETANGVSGIQQVLEAGLLSALVKSDPWLSKFDATHSRMHLPLLSNVLPKYLIYRSVVRRVTKSLRNISMFGDEQNMVQGTLYWSAWSQFKQTATERSHIDKEMEIGSAGRMLCSNKKCSKVDVKGAFMRCSGCKQSFYCSPSCQISEWKDGTHRTSCKEAQQRSKIDGMSSFFSKGDNEFITKVAIQEYKSRIEEIRQIRGSMKEADSLPLIVNLDYCCVPVKMTIGSPTTCRPPGLDNDEELRASWDAIIKKIEKRSKDIGLVYAVIPEGEATTCLMQMVDIPKNPDVRPSPTPEEVKAGLSRIVREVIGSNPHADAPGASEEERMKARAYAAGSRMTEALILDGMSLARKGNI